VSNSCEAHSGWIGADGRFAGPYRQHSGLELELPAVSNDARAWARPGWLTEFEFELRIFGPTREITP
jgi:hypothetical protein